MEKKYKLRDLINVFGLEVLFMDEKTRDQLAGTLRFQSYMLHKSWKEFKKEIVKQSTITDPKSERRFKIIYRWFDLYIGVYIDTKNKSVYVFPLPTIGLKIYYGKK